MPTVDTTPDHPTDDLGMEVEIPFIPPSQRSIKALNEEQDTIVVVGQARQKRKRPKASPDGVEEAAGERIKKTKVKNNNGVEAKDDDDEDDGDEAFDFSAVPNILDDNPNLDDGKKKKKREKKVKKGERFFLLCVLSFFFYSKPLTKIFDAFFFIPNSRLQFFLFFSF